MRKRPARLLIVTGLPGTGKTTLARMLALRWSAPLLAKDLIKEPLLDVLGAPDAAASRRLSDASFAILFAFARELACAGSSAVLEGNFRREEHTRPMRALLAVGEAARGEAPVICAQILCRAEEPERIRRLAARATDAARHRGHRDAEQAHRAAANACRATDASARAASLANSLDDYLNVPGERFCFSGDEAPDWPQVIQRLDRWWLGSRTPSARG